MSAEKTSKNHKILDFLAGKDIAEYKEAVNGHNYRGLKSMAFFGFVTVSILCIADLIIALCGYDSFEWVYLALAVYLGALNFLVRIPFIKKNATNLIHFLVGPVYVGGILLGTFLYPNEGAVAIFVLICAAPSLITDKPWKLITHIVSVTIIFVVCDIIVKKDGDPRIFETDLVYAFTFMVLSIGVNCVLLSPKMKNIAYTDIVKAASEKDIMTDVYNRGTGESLTKQIISSGKEGAFFIFDVDDFKKINDSYGHNFGDEVVKAVADATKNAFRKEDIIFRLGGDEFAIFASGVNEEQAVIDCLDRLYKHLGEISFEDQSNFKLRISVGVCLSSEADSYDFATMYKHVDDALYEAKHAGKNTYRIHHKNQE